MDADPDIAIRNATANLLVDLCLECDTKLCLELLDILEKVGSSSDRCSRYGIPRSLLSDNPQTFRIGRFGLHGYRREGRKDCSCGNYKDIHFENLSFAVESCDMCLQDFSESSRTSLQRTLCFPRCIDDALLGNYRVTRSIEGMQIVHSAIST